MPGLIVAQSEPPTEEPVPPAEATVIVEPPTPIPTDLPTLTPPATETPPEIPTAEPTATETPTSTETPTLTPTFTETPLTADLNQPSEIESAPFVAPAAACDPNAPVIRVTLPNGEPGSLRGLSVDGRYVILAKYNRTEEYSGVTEDIFDYFVFDRTTCQTSPLPNYPLDLPIAYFPGLTSADGRYVVGEVITGRIFMLEGWLRVIHDIYVHDRQTGQSTTISVAANGGLSDDTSGSPTISADGRLIAYSSEASNLVGGPFLGCFFEPGDPTFTCPDILVYDRQTGQNTRIGQSNSPPGSTDYRDINFYLFDSFSADGQYVAYTRTDDCFFTCGYGEIYHLPTGNIAYPPLDVDGFKTNQSIGSLRISGNGRYVAYLYNPGIDANGNFGIDQVMVYDLQTGLYEFISTAPNRARGNAPSYTPSISLDGRYIAYSSDAANIVSGDTNGVADVFVYDQQTDRNARISVSASGVQANGASGALFSHHMGISGDGQYVAFESDASNLVADDTNGVTDTYLARISFPALPPPPPPSPPNLLSPTDGTLTNSTTLTFTWNAAANAQQYRFVIDDDLHFQSPVEEAIVTGLSYTSTTLFDHKLYWRVEAINSTGVARSAIRYFTIDTTPPAAPTLRNPLHNSIITTARPSFSWNAVPTANRYRLQIARDPAFNLMVSNTDMDLLAAAPVTLPQEFYFWRVQARDAAGNWGTFSEIRSFQLSILRTPVNFSDTSSQRPTFQWYPYPQARRYQLQVDDSPTFDSPIIDQVLNNQQTSFQAPSNLPYGEYFWHINVDLGGGFVPSFILWRVTVKNPTIGVPVLTGPANGAVVTSPATISWTAVAGAERYEYIIDDDPTFSSPSQASTHLTSAPVDALGVRTYWKVRVWNLDNQRGGWSAARSFVVNP